MPRGSVCAHIDINVINVTFKIKRIRIRLQDGFISLNVKKLNLQS
jgi:hypothetical protein